jgi:hypothetical protein
LTILQTLLARGYFPKELPPSFYTDQFAKYATTKKGRERLALYKPSDNYTECSKYELALPGVQKRELRVPHPASFNRLAVLAARHFQRLLKKSGASPFSKSRPVYATGRSRALLPSLRPQNLAQERARSRAGCSFLLKADISHFYPSLYTHAVGWAIDPKLRIKANWRNGKLLGKQMDQALMDLDGKVSQGIPIGNDLSFLLAESVLAQIDARISAPQDQAVRWFDDYEIAFSTRDEAEACLKRLIAELSRFRLRLNAAKTKILELPQAASDEWQEHLVQTGNQANGSNREMLKHFDTAFRLREQFPNAPVLLYTLGVLFSIPSPKFDLGKVAQSCITQAVLSEPGAAQKAFALLSYWRLNGFAIDAPLIAKTIERLILRHEASGFSSDISWALAFCLEQNIPLDSKAAKALSVFDDSFIALQTLHMASVGLLPKGFTPAHFSKALKTIDLDRAHWLFAYEAARHGFSSDSKAAVTSNSLFEDLLRHKVTFYRLKLPSYANVVHPGGAPDWVVNKWMTSFLHASAATTQTPQTSSIPQAIAADLRLLTTTPSSVDDAVASLLDRIGEHLDVEDLMGDVSYPG